MSIPTAGFDIHLPGEQPFHTVPLLVRGHCGTPRWPPPVRRAQRAGDLSGRVWFGRIGRQIHMLSSKVLRIHREKI